MTDTAALSSPSLIPPSSSTNQKGQSDSKHEKDPLTDEEEECIDDWNLDGDFFVFSQHELRRIYSPHLSRPPANDDDHEENEYGGYIQVETIESLTPVDMANLGPGIHDTTGHCVWMGALLLVESLACREMQGVFKDRRVMELGCGTGIGGLAVACAAKERPSYLVLTDADPQALDLCRRNCRHNQIDIDQDSGKSLRNFKSFTKVAELTWGERLSADFFREKAEECQSFDTVLATDVLYNIGHLPLIFRSTVDCLLGQVDGDGIDPVPTTNSKKLVLSHVPRACYSTEHKPVENLDEYIVKRAKSFGLELESTIRPNDLLLNDEKSTTLPADALNATLSEMHEIGAVVFIFRLEKVLPTILLNDEKPTRRSS